MLSKNIRNWKLLSFKKLVYFPHILSPQEKRAVFFLSFVIIFSGLFLLARVYLKITVPVPAVGGTYTEGMLKEPRNINPVFAAQDADRDFSRLVFSGLFTYSGRGELKPDLAQNYEISEDGKIYTIFLKNDVRWHDGEKFTADDVVFTLQMVQNPLYRSPLRTNWQGVSIEKMDDYTLKFTLKTPYSQIMENLTLGIIPKHLWQGVNPEQAPLHELNLKPVGSGPYKFSKLKQNKDGSLSSYKLIRNSDYHGEGPYLKSISFLFFKNTEDLMGEVRRNNIDGFGPVPPEEIGKTNGNQEMYSINMPRIFGIFFNKQRAPLLEEKAIREAMAQALDKKEIASSVGSGGVIPADFALPAGSAGSMDGIAMYEFNPQKSRELLEKDGWKDEDGNGIMEKRKIVKKKEEITELRFTLSTSDWPDLIKAAETVKTELEKAGIGINIEIKPFSDLEANVIRPRNFEILLFGHVYGYEPDPFAFWHSSQIKDPGLNIAFYADKDADKLLEEARRTTDKEARVRIYADFQKQLLKDLPAIFLYSQLYLYSLPADIKGVNLEKISLPADRFNEINLWYKKTRRVLK